MAHIDNLIDSIADTSLRTALQSEVRKILGTQKFGLVFNSHKPESILLPNFTVRRGDKVKILAENPVDRSDTDKSGVWKVLRIANGRAWLRSKSEPSTVLEVEKSRIVVIREFGDPIFPGLRSTGKVSRGGDKPWHSVIKGENYHALQALLYPYENKVDVIYIDPPYNSGASDWKYNNDYVDDNDPYRHSKWLSFMDKRLRLAKRLLNPHKSIMIVSIDEKEVNRLGLLLEQVFPSANIQMISSQINPASVARKGSFGRSDEYLYFVMIGSASPVKMELGSEWVSTRGRTFKGEIRWDLIMKSGSNSARVDRPGGFYPVYIDPDGPRIHSVGDILPLDQEPTTDTPNPGLVALWPIRKDGTQGRWRLSPQTLRTRLAQQLVRVGGKEKSFTLYYLPPGEAKKIESGQYEVVDRRPDGSPITSASTMEGFEAVPSTQWRIASHDATQYGSRLLSDVIPGRKFPFPKSLYAVEDALRFFVKNNPEALVVDFFSGSGTTTHAVARLNREDGGRRRSVMVTNNEVSPEEAETLRARNLSPGDDEWEALGICNYITVPRIQAALTGIAPSGKPIKGSYKYGEEFPISEGFEENCEFFELTYEDPALVSLGRKFQAIAPLLWLKTGAVGTRIDIIEDSGWTIPADSNYGVLFDSTVWSDFVDAVNSRQEKGESLVHVFIVTDSQSEYQQIASRLNPSLDTTRLYSDYLRTFEINTVNDN